LPSARTDLVNSGTARPTQPQRLKPPNWEHFSARLPTGSGQVPPCPDGTHLRHSF
jgi:hypothetical protein